jgi:hypothetical protein
MRGGGVVPVNVPRHQVNAIMAEWAQWRAMPDENKIARERNGDAVVGHFDDEKVCHAGYDLDEVVAMSVSKITDDVNEKVMKAQLQLFELNLKIAQSQWKSMQEGESWRGDE